MDLWDAEDIDLVQPGFIELGTGGTGHLGFIAVHGTVDWREEEREGRPGAELSWEGFDEGDPVSGRGWAVLDESGSLRGHVHFHLGDDSGFVAVRQEPKAVHQEGRIATAGTTREGARATKSRSTKPSGTPTRGNARTRSHGDHQARSARASRRRQPLFTSGDLQRLAGPARFGRGRLLTAAVDDDVYEDEWSLVATVVDGGNAYLAMVHHGSAPLSGECDCPAGSPPSFCEHSVAVGLCYLGEDGDGY
jgi:hypothetical protein